MCVCVFHLCHVPWAVVQLPLQANSFILGEIALWEDIGVFKLIQSVQGVNKFAEISSA